MLDAATGLRTPVLDCSIECGQRQFGVDITADSVADDPATAHVENRGKISKPGGKPDISDIGHPHLFWARWDLVAIPVWDDVAIVIAIRCPNEATSVLGTETIAWPRHYPVRNA
jgi:hypothetical protein